VQADGGNKLFLATLARRANRGEDPATGRVQLLVARAGGAQGELVDAVAEKGRVRVAVDEARDRAETGAVDLLDFTVELVCRELSHRSRGGHGAALAEHEGVLDELKVPQSRPAHGRARCSRSRHELREIADEQPGAAGRPVTHGRGEGGSGTRSPCSSAASSASSYPASA
jgi:hypothetical protein